MKMHFARLLRVVVILFLLLLSILVCWLVIRVYLVHFCKSSCKLQYLSISWGSERERRWSIRLCRFHWWLWLSVCICLENWRMTANKNKCFHFMHLANCSSTHTHTQQTNIFHYYCFGHHLRPLSLCTLDKSNFMASNLFNLILSIQFLQQFGS